MYHDNLKLKKNSDLENKNEEKKKKRKIYSSINKI